MVLEHFYPEIIIAFFALATLFIDLTLKKDYKEFLGYFSLAGITLALISVIMQSISTMASYSAGKEVQVVFFNGMIYNDLFAIFFKVVFLVVALFVVLASIDYTRKDNNKGEYYSLILFATFGMMLVAMAGDLILLFVSLELASISTYALTAFRKNKANTEAAMKYFIIGALSSGIIVFGMSILYGVTGTTNIYEIAKIIPHVKDSFNSALMLSVVLLIGGFGYKIAAFPFHMWAPDAYQGAPSTISAYLAAATKKMGFVAIIRILVIALPLYVSEWSVILGVLAVLTMTVGNFSALKQTNIKRMLAYSSIAQAGYVIAAIAVLSSTTPNVKYLAVAAALLHILTHALMKGGAFIAVAGVSLLGIGTEIKNYRGLGKRMPVTAMALTIFLLSLAGIPFFAGFISKFLILAATVDAGGIYIWLGIFLIINSVVSIYYYGRVIKYMYFEDFHGDRLKEPTLIATSLVVLAFLVVLIGIAPQNFVHFSLYAAASLFSHGHGVVMLH
ncbi:MAG TPA: NADH-quinone oxidoreductase subunit N [Euryarchaeota archaeon]|nr:NADH-quinone oxidoreductase subunit N [Euryarchaeota archaeon]